MLVEERMVQRIITNYSQKKSHNKRKQNDSRQDRNWQRLSLFHCKLDEIERRNGEAKKKFIKVLSEQQHTNIYTQKHRATAVAKQSERKYVQ